MLPTTFASSFSYYIILHQLDRSVLQKECPFKKEIKKRYAARLDGVLAAETAIRPKVIADKRGIIVTGLLHKIL